MTGLRRGAVAVYLGVAFLNAFVDLGHKIVIQNTVFKVYDGPEQIALTAVLNALILLPYIVLFSPAGFVADKYPKNRIMYAAAWVAVALTLAITGCYYAGWFWPAYALTFVMAVQSAIYSPAKYGYLKLLVGKARLGEGNGLVQATTIVAILAGTFVYSILFELRFGAATDASKDAILRATAPLGWLLVINSLFEAALAHRLRRLETGSRPMRFDWGGYLRGRSLKATAAPALNHRLIRTAIIGLAVFWAVSQVMLATYPAFAKAQLGQTNTVIVQGTLAASGIGIMLGSLLAARLSRHHIETGTLPLAAVGLAAGLLWLPSLHSEWAQIVNFVFVGTMGGLFIVPLNAMIQFHARDNELGKVLASNNLIQNLAMLGFLIATVALAGYGFGPVVALTLVGAVALVGCFYTVIRLPQSLLRLALGVLMQRRYRLTVSGLDWLPERAPVVLTGARPTVVEAALLQIALPRPIHFERQWSKTSGWRGALLGRLTARVVTAVPAEIGITWATDGQTGEWRGARMLRVDLVHGQRHGLVTETVTVALAGVAAAEAA